MYNDILAGEKEYEVKGIIPINDCMMQMFSTTMPQEAVDKITIGGHLPTTITDFEGNRRKIQATITSIEPITL